MKRILSCYTNNYGAFGVSAALAHIRQAGINHLELAMKPHNLGGLIIPEEAVITETTDDSSAAAFVASMQTAGVLASGANVGGGDLRTPVGTALTERRIRIAHRWFGVPVAVTGVGQPEDEAQRKLMIASLQHLGQVAEELDMTLALETHKGPTQNAQAMLRLMDEIDHPRVRLNFDTGNIGYYNPGVDPVRELEQVAPLVRNVHLKDSRGRPEDWYFPALGDGGSVNFSAVRAILDSVGFTGPYTIEIEGILGEPEPGLAGRHDRVARSVEHLRICGYFD